MEIVKGRYGECRFCDNMDPEFGLPSLEEKSWDLCLTDPPYNVKWGVSKVTNTSQKRFESIIAYEDDNPNYMKSLSFLMDNRIWNKICFSCGNANFREWILLKDWNRVIWIDMSKQGGVKGAKLTKWEYFLTDNLVIPLNIIIYNSNNERGEGFKHPCPKPTGLWKILIEQIKPLNVIDPFLGSGTTAEVCESLKIPWLGFEIMEEYAVDIEKRIKRGIEKSKQTNLEAFFT